IRSPAIVLGLFFAWQLVLLGVLRVLRWPGLLRLARLAGLAATSGRGLTVWAAHLAAVRAGGRGVAALDIAMLVDPVEWAFILIGLVLCVRAWHLADAARQILPTEAQVVSPPRRALVRVLFGLTAVYALVFLGFAAYSRYESS